MIAAVAWSRHAARKGLDLPGAGEESRARGAPSGKPFRFTIDTIGGVMHSESTRSSRATTLQLFGSWQLRAGDEFSDLRGRERRLTALVALSGPRPRAHLAGSLWPASDERSASTNLRSAVWHIRQAVPDLLCLERGAVSLAPTVRTDVEGFRHSIDEAMSDPSSIDDEARLHEITSPDLLPGWYDDWVLYHRELMQHQSVRALERVAAHHLDHGDPEIAAAAATAAIALEPLRETPYQFVIRAHIAAGNRSYALMAFHDYRDRLRVELGIEPSQEMRDLAGDVPRQRRPHPN